MVAEECRLQAEGRSMSIDELTSVAKAWRDRHV
jgi:hypothetical protein